MNAFQSQIVFTSSSQGQALLAIAMLVPADITGSPSFLIARL